MTGSAATILIVDDELLDRRLLESLLLPEGYLTLTAASGEEALASVAQRAPDLILLDIMMPDMDGHQVAGLLKSNPATASIPIVMLTAQYDRSARLAGLDAGAEDFLTKPVDRAELWLRVRNLLRLKEYSDYLKNHGAVLERQVQARTADLQRFRTAMDSTADAIYLVNRTTMAFVELNATACNMLGYTREELFKLGPAQMASATPEHLESVYDAIISGHPTNELEETRLQRKDGSQLQVEVRRHAHRSGADWIIVGVMHDITERNEAEKRLERLHQLAHYDALTGLPNRRLFNETLRKTLAQASDRGWQVAVLFIDLDDFKNVNDTLGHAAGDELLGQFSSRLAQCVRTRDTVGRLGGDEFALILVMDDSQQGAALVANKVREVLRAPFNLQGHEVAVTASIGITVHPDDASDPETLLRCADTAMYRAKQAGRDTSRFFTAQMNAEASARSDLELALREAVEYGEFVLHYQPTVQLDSGRIAGIEALLRWQRPGYGLVPPQDFIPILEATGLIHEVGRWALRKAVGDYLGWRTAGLAAVRVAVNVSPQQLRNRGFIGEIRQVISIDEQAAAGLELEITESLIMEDVRHSIESLQEIRAMGITVAIDDFGTGFSSLSYLSKLPVDTLKIDRSFVADMTAGPEGLALVSTIINLAHPLTLKVVAEGVETEEQSRLLRLVNCDEMQGFLFSKPLSGEIFEARFLAPPLLASEKVDAPRQV